MASVFQNTLGGWTVQWNVGRDRTGKMVRDSKTFATEQAAIAHKHMIESAVTGTGRESLEARGLAWVEDRLNLGRITDRTAAGYVEKLKGWGRLLGPAPYKKLTSADIDRAFGRLAAGETPTGRKPSPRTLHHYRTALACFFNAMEKKNEIARNPVRGVEGVGGLEKTTRAPTAAELQRILTIADASPSTHGQLATIIRVASHLGLRRGELCALRWCDVDFEAMTVTIARAATQLNGRIKFKLPKTKAGLRTITMLEPTAALLREQRKRTAAWRLAAGSAWAKNDLVFSNPLGEVLNLDRLTHAASWVRNKAGLPRAVMPLHGQRHYALTSLHKASVDLLTIQTRAGHSDVRSTQTYITVDIDKDREAAEKAASSLL